MDAQSTPINFSFIDINFAKKIIDVDACYTPDDSFITVNKKCHAGQTRTTSLFPL